MLSTAGGYDALEVGDLRVGGDDREREAGDPDRGDEDDDSRRVEQPADHHELHQRAEERADDEGCDRREPERDLVLDDEEREQARPDETHVADGEVDHPRGPVDEHDAHREEPDLEAGDHPVEDELRRDPGRDDAHGSAAFGPEEHRTCQVVALGELGRRTLEAHLRPSRGTPRGRRPTVRRSATARRG